MTIEKEVNSKTTMDDFERDIFWKAQEENRALTREEIDMLNQHHLKKLHANKANNKIKTK
jgi:hypothetical protein